MCKKDKTSQDSPLDNLVIASPCSVPWDAMTGDNRKRLCSGCSNFVHNISDMTKSEAEDFLAENGTSECMIFYRRTDGTIMTDDCPKALRKLRDGYRFGIRVAAAIFSFLISLPASFCQQAASSGKNAPPTESQKNPANNMRMNRFGMLVGPDWKEPTPPPGYHYQGNPAGGGMILVKDQGQDRVVKGEAVSLPKPGKPLAQPRQSQPNQTKANTGSCDEDPVMLIKKMANDQAVRPIAAGRPMIKHPVSPGLAFPIPQGQTDQSQQAQSIPPKNRPLLDTKAYESYKKGEEAEKIGKKSLAEFHYEKALEAYDSQPAGDSGFRVQIENALKRLQNSTK